ncbi:T9SS type A sorting domain-containing protein [Flavobacterium sp. LC2016-23]|uniref:T9SS type A sorting domain-containing protein n=1 Tax=Flavobacterium sp. LC2016-23 TaxID=2666330 RepID=UPI001E318AB7|nr:T9SS type A sorting domain-containing protein [Flavobacterium sp. LC2016-23]
MKKTVLLFLILATTKCLSQIYFSPNAFMYVKNEVLYVQENVNLDSNSNLYLRNNSQLLQGSASTSGNTGTGKLSVYQEGTADNFDYNYWCSPVGNASAVSGNENFGITMLNRPATLVTAVPAVILPASNYNGIANPLSISSAWVYKLTNANNYSQWTFVGGASLIAPGEGFTMKGTGGTDSTDPEGTGIVNNPGSAQRYDFRGKPNDGNISITLGANNSTLTGNPYPSALHLNAFLLDPSNTATAGIAYFWEQDKTINSHYLTDYRGGYGTYSPIALASNGIYVPATFNSYNADGSLNTTGLSSGLVIQRKYSPVGQGFVVNANANGTAVFKNAHRIFYKEGGGLSQFEKHTSKDKESKGGAFKDQTAEEVSHIKLNTIINSQFTRQLALAFSPEATDGIDNGIDALNMDEALPDDVAFWLENGNYVIQGLNFEEDKRIPLIIKATTNATFKFYIAEVVNFSGAHPIYLYDAHDQSYHDIKNAAYQVTVAPGLYKDRFKITFKNTGSLALNSEITTQFFIIQDNANSSLKAANPDNLAIKSFKLYNMLGMVVLSAKNLETAPSYVFSTSGLSQGIYIAEFLTVDNEKLTDKIVISNTGK